MPRTARKFSNSGYLHLIVRGIGRQTLFEEEGDYKYYLKILQKYGSETEVSICAYCLMDNHVHLLVRDANGNVPILMKKLGVSYSHYYNQKYDRCGHLFQNRYLSEPVDSDRYLLTVFRYILNNPKKSGICAAQSYKWSSYDLYTRPDSFVDTKIFHKLIGGKKEFQDFMGQTGIVDDDGCLEHKQVVQGDARARQILQDYLGVQNGSVIQAFNREERNKVLRHLKLCGLTVRQIERLTGIGRNIIQRV